MLVIIIIKIVTTINELNIYDIDMHQDYVLPINSDNDVIKVASFGD
jgi:hypothetical protein